MEVYRENILEHYRAPRNQGHLKNPNRQGKAVNPLCGDSLSIELSIGDDGRVTDVAFTGTGCAVSQASASLMTETMRGKTVGELTALGKDDVFQVLGGPIAPSREPCALLVLKGVTDALTKGHG